MTITLDKRIFIWIAVFILQAVFIAYMQGMFALPGQTLKLTEAESRLAASAIVLVQSDIAAGKLTDTVRTRAALAALLPESIRVGVLTELGTPSMQAMPEALQNLLDEIQPQ